jgi:hypothetical protein
MPNDDEMIRCQVVAMASETRNGRLPVRGLELATPFVVSRPTTALPPSGSG